MKRIVVIIPTLIILLGFSNIAFAKHHHHHKEDDKKNKVPCLVKGVQQMVKSENACKDLKGTIVTDKTPQEATTESEKKMTVRKIQSE